MVRSDIIERTHELLLLTRVTTEAERGVGSVGLLVGPVASGKTALLSALCEQAGRSGFTVLRALGAEAEHHTPLGIAAQLLQQAPLDGDRAEQARHILDAVTRSALPPGAEEPGEDWQLPTDLVQALSTIFFELSATAPLLICVDDVHQADAFSLRWLLFLIRRLGTARIAMVLTERTARQHPHPAFHGELLRQPHCRRVMVGPLSNTGVVELLLTQLDAQQATELAPRFDALTGGSPLLVHALLEDLRSTTRLPTEQRADGLGAGYAFSEAVVSCLHRSEPTALAVARGIAVLGDESTPHLLAQLLNLPPGVPEGVMRDLHQGGLLDGERFGHAAVRTAVLRDADPAELSRLHQEAARLLYGQGAPERAIAEHLLAAEYPGEDWSTRVLCDVARQALHDGDANLARDCVEHALRNCTDPRERGIVITLQAGVLWQLRGDATRQLPQLTTALEAGELSDRHSMVVVRYLLRHGRLTRAASLLEHILQQGHEPEGRTLAEMQIIRLLLASSYPGALPDLPPFGACVAYADRAPAAVRADPRLQAAAVLDEVLSGRADENAFLGAEQVLRGIGLSYRDWEQVEFALLALIYCDQLERAAACCEQLLERIGRAAGGWRPPLLALRSLIAVRQGHLVEAERSAKEALEQTPWQCWGVNIGLPLANLLTAQTLMGKYEDAAALLSRPVPKAVYKTRHGLHYLFARAEYRLATNNLQAALEDFLICGEMMQEWDLDLPSVLPWRGGAARVHLEMGNLQQAKVLIDEQAKRLQPGPSRSRGITTRLGAAVTELKNRPALLRQAVDELQRRESMVELAQALADLGHAYQSLGDHKRSRMMMSRAWQLAKEHHAEPLVCGISSLFSQLHEEAAPPKAPTFADGLSDAERRVASLAVLGYTNREIARELFITVSTVEQHLTRVYRKLKVNRRSDLPSELYLANAAGADTSALSANSSEGTAEREVCAPLLRPRWPGGVS